MNNLFQGYEIILKEVQKFDISYEPFIQIRTPKLSNIECLSLILNSEYMSIDSEVSFLEPPKELHPLAVAFKRGLGIASGLCPGDSGL